MTKTVVIAGALAQKPRQAGHTWQFLQYLLGFRRLGWDVLFLDQMERNMYVDATGQPCVPEKAVNLNYVQQVMKSFNLQDSFAVVCNEGRDYFGLPRAKVMERVRQSSFLLNIMGYLKNDEIMSLAPRRVFLDTDPGFGQMWQDLGLHNLFYGHDDFVTIGENIGKTDCTIPTCGIKWITTPQPVVLEQWNRAEAHTNGAFTSIGSWRGPYGPIEYKGKTYGLRVHEFRKFVEIPRRNRQSFEVALDIHPEEVRDLNLLRAGGWSLVDPYVVACDPHVYRRYIQSSRAEFMVAKGIYVQSKSGWFSERSMCYLASGVPVLVQDTGLADLYPTGDGLLIFSTLDEAIACVEELMSKYDHHRRAARSFAAEYFDSDKVLRGLLAKLGIE
jgi:hypothetical protein